MEFSCREQVDGPGLSNSAGKAVSWTAAYVTDKATVVVNGSGRLRYEDMRGIAQGTTDLLRRNGASRVLFDWSEAVLDVHVVDVFYLPDCYERVGVPRSARIALVAPRKRQPSSICEFFETVCRNKGYTCKLFYSQQSAEQWLG